MSPSRLISSERLNAPAVTTFKRRTLPVPAYLAGYSALIEAFDLELPLPYRLSAVATKNIRRREDGWAIYPQSSRPAPTLVDHLIFAFKYEGVELLVLKNLFEATGPRELVAAAKVKPTSAYLRRLCFFYEWLTEQRLDIDDVSAGAYVDALDPKQQYAVQVELNVKRFRVRDNLPGSRAFCPLVYRTRTLDSFMLADMSGKARAIVESAPRELIARAAAFLLLSDSKASFEIEGERSTRDRIARWGQVIGKAGQVPLSIEEFVRLQRELIGDDRFVKIGLRDEAGFVGRHDSFGQPEPEHISAKATDLDDLMNGLIEFSEMTFDFDYDPVLAAASIAFGFVYIHPFEDGNGRLHRFLIHHTLAERRFTPEQIVFPISSVILDDIARYKDVLESVSRPLLDVIRWTPTDRGNVRVAGETADFYRYFDATAHSEYLFKCILRAVEKNLPEELSFLEHCDEFHRSVTEVVDMSERTLDLLLRFLRQNHGSLSKRARSQEFSALTELEVERITTIYSETFGGR